MKYNNCLECEEYHTCTSYFGGLGCKYRKKKTLMDSWKLTIVLILTLILVLGYAREVSAAEPPVLTLKANELNGNGERYIKVSWKGERGSYELQIDNNEDFSKTITKKQRSKNITSYNFILPDNVEATYYIRARKGNGPWSNTVVASMDNKLESVTKPYFKIPTMPKIPDIKVDMSGIDFSKFNIKIPARP